MATCPNKNTPEWKNLVKSRGENIAYFLWDKYDGIPPTNVVNFELKSFKLLASKKAKQVFTKGKKNGWNLNKILTELQVPKEQKQIILDYKDNYVNNIFKNLEKECS